MLLLSLKTSNGNSNIMGNIQKIKHPNLIPLTQQHASFFRAFVCKHMCSDHVPATIQHSPYKMQVPRGLRRLRPFPVLSPQRQSKTMSTPSAEILHGEKTKNNTISCQRPNSRSLSLAEPYCLLPESGSSSRSSSELGRGLGGGFILLGPTIRISQSWRQLRIWLVTDIRNQLELGEQAWRSLSDSLSLYLAASLSFSKPQLCLL